ncbi:MAG: hypothetical protein AAGH68_13350 [Pseudomonadota bacterium]
MLHLRYQFDIYFRITYINVVEADYGGIVMTRSLGLRIALVALAALAGLGVSGEAVAEVAGGTGAPTMLYLGEVLIFGAVAGALLLLDTTSWSWMTSRRR